MVVRFDGQVAIVTGSGRGLGATYARLLGSREARVVVHDAKVAIDGTGFDPGVADAVVREITTAGRVAVPSYENIVSREGCQRLIKVALSQFGRLDILINNAGWITFTPLEDMTPALLEHIITIQIAAPFWLSQAAFPVMQRQQYGRVIFKTSGRATFMEDALPAYGSLIWLFSRRFFSHEVGAQVVHFAAFLCQLICMLSLLSSH